MIASALLFSAGAVGWSLTEYGLHRGLGHKPRFKNPFTREHIRHHAKVGYFAPTSKKVAAAAGFGSVVIAATTPWLGPIGACAFASGFLGAYALYEVTHRRLHTHGPRGPYSRFLRKHHFHHHFENPKMNHGVTTPIWDLVFGSYEPAALVRVPQKLTPQWMRAGELSASDYQIV